MRSFLLATLAAIAIPACTNDITGGSGGGGGGGGDDGSGTGDTCSCPDGSTLPAGECATECPAPSSGAGAIAVATDLATYPGQLMTTVTANVTVTGSQGFSGLVTLAATVTGAGGAAITEWPVSFDNSMVSVTTNGTATAKATVTIPSTAIPSTDPSTLAGTLNITATPSTTSVTAASTTAALAISNTLEIDMSSTATACSFPAEVLAAPIQVAVGTTINWKNTGTVGYVIHVDSTTSTGATNNSGISHQGEGAPALDPTVTSPAGAAAPLSDVWPELVARVVTGNVTWHCHAPDTEPKPSPAFTIVMPQ